MMSEEQLNKFIVIYEKQYGFKPDRNIALLEALALLNLFKTTIKK